MTLSFRSISIISCLLCLVGNVRAQHKDSLAFLKKIAPSDTVLNKYISNNRKLTHPTDIYRQTDSLQRVRLQQMQDSILNELKKPQIDGSLYLGHDYGLLPYIIDSTRTEPISMYSTRGDLTVLAAKIPLRVQYAYASIKLPYGLNNYFRVSIDFNKLQQLRTERENQIRSKFLKEQQLNTNKLDSLQGKLGYAETMKNYAKAQMEKEKRKLNQLNWQQQHLPDSIQTATTQDSLMLEKQHCQEKIAYYEAVYDTVNVIYEQVSDLYQLYQQQTDEIQSKKSKLLTATKILGDPDGILKNTKFMSGFHKVNLGLSYPKTSGLSTSTIGIKGFDVEHEFGNWYTSLSAGLTVNNLTPTNNQLQNGLTNQQNSFNFFDFQFLKENQLLTAIKTGIGNPQSQHFLVGFRHLSQPEWFQKNQELEVSPSYGLELDVRLKPKKMKDFNLDLVYGKTNITPSDSTNHSGLLAARTNCGLIKAEQRFVKFKSDISASWRWIDPLADTRNIGVLQADNARMEWQSKHQLLKRLQIAFLYRNDRNNLDKKKDSTLTINLTGAQLQTAISKYCTVAGSLSYVQLYLKSISGERGSSKVNYLFNLMVNSNYQIRKSVGMLSLMYSDNYITAGTSVLFFRNYGVQHHLIYKQLTWISSWNYFVNNQSQQEISTQVYATQLDYKLKKVSLKASLRYATPSQKETSIGYRLELMWVVNRLITWSSAIDKPVAGDYYNSFLLARYDKFPVTIQSKLIFNLATRK